MNLLKSVLTLKIDGTFSLEYGVTGIPETFYIDKQGFIKEKILGVVSIDGISEFLDKELGLR